MRWENLKWRVGNPYGYPGKRSYSDVTLCDDWQDYDKFAEWFETYSYELHDGSAAEIDKDIRYWGVCENKVYCPAACLFVPKEINVLFRQFNPEKHVKYDEKKQMFKVNIKSKHIEFSGYYDTKEEAMQEYCNIKNKILDKLIRMYADDMP